MRTGLLFLRVLLSPFRLIFLRGRDRFSRLVTICLSGDVFYFLLIHLRLGTPYAQLQLVDLFSYEAAGTAANAPLTYLQFNNVREGFRFGILCRTYALASVTELFFSAN